MNKNIKNWFTSPLTGFALTILMGLSFFLLCMILPLVGPAGSQVEHALMNEIIFIRWLFITFLLSALAFTSKLMLYKTENTSKPIISLIIMLICILIFVLFLSDRLSI